MYLKWPHSHFEKEASDGKRLRGVHGEDHYKRLRLPSANSANSYQVTSANSYQAPAVRSGVVPSPFGVYHPKKPTQIRVVFDSSAEYEGVSLNGELLSGPDLMNSLLGVLFRFRMETTAVMCDIEQMFMSIQSIETSCISFGMKTTHPANG